MKLGSSPNFPDFGNIPNWAKWIAQDADGAIWAYEVEPLQFHKGWYENEVGRCIKLSQGEAQSNWHLMLKRC